MSAPGSSPRKGRAEANPLDFAEQHQWRDINPEAVVQYQAGIAPLDYAEEQVALQVGVYMALLAAGDDFGIHLDPSRMTVGAVACRILGALLDAGWEPPVWPVPEPGECT